MLSVPLTTVAWPTAEIGQQAARLLIEMIEGNGASRAPQNVILTPRLIPRRSSVADVPKSKTARTRSSR
jgi:DNA-binding LacI/PurR family transcriptional regulator